MSKGTWLWGDRVSISRKWISTATCTDMVFSAPSPPAANLQLHALENSSQNPQKDCQGHGESEQPALLSCLKGHRGVHFIMAGWEHRVRSVQFSKVPLHNYDVGKIKHSYTCIMLATSNQKSGICYYFLVTYMWQTNKEASKIPFLLLII